MGEHRGALEPQPQRLPMDRGDHLRGHQRVAPQHTGERPRVERAALQLQAGVETGFAIARDLHRSEEHTSELQSLMRISYAVLCLKKTTDKNSILYEKTIQSPQ